MAASITDCGKNGADPVANDAALEAEIGARADRAGGDDLRPADRRDDERAVGDGVGDAVLEDPVGVGDEAIDVEKAAFSMRDHVAEELGARALDEGEGRGREARGILRRGRDDRADDVAVEEGIELRRSDEGRDFALGRVDQQEAEAARMDGDASAGIVHDRAQGTRSQRLRRPLPVGPGRGRLGGCRQVKRLPFSCARG